MARESLSPSRAHTWHAAHTSSLRAQTEAPSPLSQHPRQPVPLLEATRHVFAIRAVGLCGNQKAQWARPSAHAWVTGQGSGSGWEGCVPGYYPRGRSLV